MRNSCIDLGLYLVCQFDVNLPDDISGLQELQYEEDEVHRKVEQVGGGPAAAVPPIALPHRGPLALPLSQQQRNTEVSKA